MPSLTNLITLLKFAAIAAAVAAFGWLYMVHTHDRSTIAGQVQLLAQAGTQKNLDAATIAQLRSDLNAQSDIVGKLGGTTVAAFKAVTDAQLATAKLNAPLQAEIAHLKLKNAVSNATGKTCTDAINEWRARQ